MGIADASDAILLLARRYRKGMLTDFELLVEVDEVLLQTRREARQ